jgi:hypothetical protein
MYGKARLTMALPMSGVMPLMVMMTAWQATLIDSAA